ncbi:MAG TPA: GNAT family N-acetyltransferase, partial [Spirochaetales bacterium]|nr:GNAT family N-acetyltransferase [Spirochaetales bacterium]
VGERLQHLAWRLSEEGLGLDEICRVTYLSRPAVLRALAEYATGLFGVVIESERLLQVAIRHDFDADIFREFTPAVATYMYPAPTCDRADTRAFVDSSIEGLQTGEQLQLVIVDKERGEFIGCSGLHGLGRSDPELGIWTKLSAHGQGYGREAVTAIVAWARSNASFERLVYPVDKRNVASRRIPESLDGVIAREFRQLNQAGFELDEVEYWITR